MDVRYFLEKRLSFIQQLYGTSSAPFVERKRKIEAAEEPFVSPCSEDPEPAFLEEWIEAEESLKVIGNSCITMLSAAFHLYLRTWQGWLGEPPNATYKSAMKSNWFNGYKVYFKERSNVIFENCPCRLDLLEEITLARNAIQHQKYISNPRPHYSPADLEKLKSPFFIEDGQQHLLADMEEHESFWFMPPEINVTQEKLEAAISEVARFAKWLEETYH